MTVGAGLHETLRRVLEEGRDDSLSSQAAQPQLLGCRY